MRVIVLGLSRTGTAGICAALRKLGYTPYQMRDLLINTASFPLWDEAIRLTLLPVPERPKLMRNRTVFPPYGREEFDTLLSEHDAVADLPAALFPEQLIEAYPQAKIIVTTKPYEEWEANMQNSVWLLCKWKLFTLTRKLGVTQMAPLIRLMHLIFRVHNGNHYGGPEARKAYEKYYADVRELVPQHRRLEIENGEGDWEALCAFLDVGEEKRKEVEGTPYPRMDESASMAQGLKGAWWDVFQWFFMMGMMVFVGLFGFAAIYYGERFWAAFERGLKVLEPYVAGGLFVRSGNVTETATAVVSSVTAAVSGKDEL
jgi:hypothetical protein